MTKTFLKTLCLSLLALVAGSAWAAEVYTQDELSTVVAAANPGDCVEITAAGIYTIPNVPQNITIKGAVEGVVFNCEGFGSIASVPNGATFENVTMTFGNTSYHGFQHAGTINMNGCTLNGLFFSYGDMNFDGCKFYQTTTEYLMWLYAGDITFKDCECYANGKFFNVYNEGNDDGTPWAISVEGCKFYSTKSNKAVFNIKDTCVTKQLKLKYEVEIAGNNICKDCTYSEGTWTTLETSNNYPAASTATDSTLYVASPLWQVDDRNISADEHYITVKENGKEVFKDGGPITSAPVAKIGDVKYATLAEAIADVPTDGTETTITMIANEAIDVAGTSLTVAKNQNIVLDLNGFEIAGVCSTGTGSALIVNKGGLTIKDSSTEGTGKMTYGANPTWIYDGGDDYSGSYASNLISNFGTLTIESGYFENAGTGSACYAIDNNSNVDNAILTVNGGTIKGKSTAVRQFCNSTTTDNTVNVNGGTIEGGYAGIWIQLPGNSGQAKKAALNVTGGTLKGEYAFYDYTYGDVYDAVQYNLSGGTFDGYIFSYGANMTITDGTYNGEIDIKQTQPSRLSVTGGKFSADICAYGDNASTGFISGGVYKDYTFEYEQQTYGCYWSYSIDPRYEAIYNTDETTKEEYPYTVGLKEQIIIPEVEETLDITTDDEQQKTIPDDKKEEVAAAVVAALTQNSSVNNMTAEETNINNAVPVSETQVDSERRLKVELTSAVVAAETITEQTTTTTTTVKGATFEVKPVYVYEEGGVTKTEIVRNEDIKAPITFRLAVQKNIQDDCAKVWHQAVVYKDGKAEADPNSPKEYLGVFPIQTADNGEKYIQLSASKFSFYNYLTKSMEKTTLVAQIGDATFETLAEAIAAVKDGETIKMIANVTGADGISVESGKNFTVDFDNHTYTLGGDDAGSAGTQTQGFQLLQGSTITFKNGTINCSEANKDRTWTPGSSEPKGIAMLIQNYANLTLNSMTIDGSNIAHNGAATRYVLSNNSGNVRYTGATTITAAEGDKAFDVYKYGTYDAPTITIDDAQVTINGNIEAAGGKLNISAGTVNGTISTDTGYTPGDIAISGGSFSEKVKDEYCATGFQPVTEEEAQGGMYTVKVKDVVLTVYANSTEAEEMTIPAFLAAQQTYHNAMAVVSATYSEDVKGLDNVILDYPVGKGGHYYECDNFVLTDKEYWYSPVDFMAVEGAYERTNTGGMNSVCLPFDMTKTDVNGGVFGTFHSTSISSAIGGESTGVAYFREVNEIKAGTPCLVKCESDEAWEIDLAGRYIVSAIDQSSAIQGSYMKKTIGTGFFKVSCDGAGFSTTTASSTVTPFRTYLDLTYQSSIGGDESNVQSFNIIFKEEVTGISTTSVQNENQTFDLNGRMQNSLQKGVNVVRAQNGYKKILK